MALLAHETVFEAIDLYAISWGTPRRPAYNLGETTKRKSQKRVLIWIYEGELGIEYQQTLVARYRCAYDARRGELQGVSEPRLYTTAFTSPQLELIELDDEQWVKFQRRPSRTYTKRTAMIGQQLSLLDLATSALFLLALKAI